MLLLVYNMRTIVILNQVSTELIRKISPSGQKYEAHQIKLLAQTLYLTGCINLNITPPR